MSASIDDAKSQRLIKAFVDALNAEHATAAEGCAAASFVFKMAVEQAPTPVYKAALKAACIRAMEGLDQLQ